MWFGSKDARIEAFLEFVVRSDLICSLEEIKLNLIDIEVKYRPFQSNYSKVYEIFSNAFNYILHANLQFESVFVCFVIKLRTK